MDSVNISVLEVRIKEEDEEPAMPQWNEKPFEFLKLPAEVRNIIYRHVLVKKRYCSLFFQPPLTLANKQIRSESLPVLYGNNKFIIYLKAGMLVHTCERLRRLWAVPSPVVSVSAMSSFHYIAHLDIRFSFVTEWWFSGPKPRGLDLYVSMKKGGWSRRDSMKNGAANQHCFKWRDWSIITAAYEILMQDYLGRPRDGGQKRLANEGRESVEKSVLYFAEICPAASECVWMEFDTKPLRRALRP